MKRLIICSSFILIAFGFSQNGYQNQDNEIFLAPRLVNYQGYLTDTLSNPITNPSLSMVFSIWNSSAAGTQKWTETQSVAVEKGIFHVLLGSITPIPDTVFTASTTRYLQISIAGNPLTPRTRVVSAPYAYTSTYADTALYAANVATGNLDDRYVNVLGRDSIYANSPSPTFTVSTYGSGMGVYAWRDTTLLTNPVITGLNNGSGAGLYGTATQDDNGSAGVIGKHSNYRPGVFGYYDVFSGVPRVRAGVAAYSTVGPAFYAQSGSLMGVYVDTIAGSAFQVMQTGCGGYYVGSAGWYGVCIDSNNPAYSAIIVNKGGYNGVSVNTAGNHGFSIATPNQDGFNLANRAGRYGLYINYAVSNGINIDSAGARGIDIGYAKNRGISIDSSGSGLNGFFISKAGATGYAVNTTVSYGFYGGTCGNDGVNIASAVGNDGYYIGSARHGLNVNGVTSHGVRIGRADSCGVNVVTAGIYGVCVDSAATAGLQVNSSGSYGLYLGTTDYGVYVDSTRVGNDGVWVNHALDDGFYVSNAASDGYFAYTTGAAGLYVSDAGTYGVYANSPDQRGGYFRNNNNSYYTLTAWNNTGTGGTINGAYIQGHGYATGGWQTFLADGKTGFAPAMPDQEIIVSGSAALTDGRASVQLDPVVAAAFSTDIPVRVIVTPTSECNGVCVTGKSTAGFLVKELMRGSSAATFDWIVIARAKGYEKTIYTPPITAEDPAPDDAENRPRPKMERSPRHAPDDHDKGIDGNGEFAGSGE